MIFGIITFFAEISYHHFVVGAIHECPYMVFIYMIYYHNTMKMIGHYFKFIQLKYHLSFSNVHPNLFNNFPIFIQYQFPSLISPNKHSRLYEQIVIKYAPSDE